MPEVLFQWARHITEVWEGETLGVSFFHPRSLKMGAGVQWLCGTPRLASDWLCDLRQMM